MNRIKLCVMAWPAGLLLLAGILVSGCGESRDPGPDLAGIDLAVEVTRLDRVQVQASRQLEDSAGVGPFIDAYEQYLRPYREPFYYLSGVDMIDYGRVASGADSLTAGQRDSAIAFKMGTLLADSAFGVLADSVAQRFSPEYDLRNLLEPVLKRYHYYFPTVEVPALYSHINGYDPSGNPGTMDQFFAGPGFISVGLHFAMGPDFPYYSPNIPRYIRRRFDPAFLDVLLALELARGTAPALDPASQTSVLEVMLQQGIQQYIVQKLVPLAPDSMVMLYTAEEMAWANKFERPLFKDIAPRMFDSDLQLRRKLLGENAFTAGYTQTSAPRLGAFLGWRMVQAYMNRHPETSLLDLVQTRDFEKLYRESGYKP